MKKKASPVKTLEYSAGTNQWTEWTAFPTTYCGPTCTVNYNTAKIPTKEEENKMTEYNIEVDQRKRLTNRLSDIKIDKQEKLTEKYHMDDPKVKSKDELLKLLSNPKSIHVYKDEFHEDSERYACSVYRLVDPERDEEGYVVASRRLEKAHQEAKDVALVMPLADGLAALREFEKTEF